MALAIPFQEHVALFVIKDTGFPLNLRWWIEETGIHKT